MVGDLLKLLVGVSAGGLVGLAVGDLLGLLVGVSAGGLVGLAVGVLLGLLVGANTEVEYDSSQTPMS